MRTVGSRRVLVAQQPGYLPFAGFFDKVRQADVLVLQDDLQYVKQEWQSRNRIKHGDGWRWLSVPVHARSHDTLSQAVPVGVRWVDSHRRICEYEYRDAPFRHRLGGLWDVLRSSGASLADVNGNVIEWMLAQLGIAREIHRESRLALPRFDNPNDRLIFLCRLLECDAYLSGQGGANYIDRAAWERTGIDLRWQELDFPEYERGTAPWVPNLSLLDAQMYLADPRAALGDRPSCSP